VDVGESLRPREERGNENAVNVVGSDDGPEEGHVWGHLGEAHSVHFQFTK
jgi:hypothetical protein